MANSGNSSGSALIAALRAASPAKSENPGFTMYRNGENSNGLPARQQVNNTLFNPVLNLPTSTTTTPRVMGPLPSKQVGQAIYDSYQQGYKLPQIQSGLQSQYNVTPDQFNSALDDRLGQAIAESYQQGFNIPLTKQGAMEKLGATEQQFNSALDKRLAQAISESLGQGFNMDLTRQGALTKLGVSNADFDRALALYNSGLI